MDGPLLTRRNVIEAAAGFAIVSAAGSAVASPLSQAAIARVTKGASVTRGRVSVSMPTIAENGLSVFTTIAVESPMTASDFVQELHLISEKNPVAVIASFFFTPAMAEAKVSTNIRLAQTQRLTAIAMMSDGSLWSDEKDVVVTIAACIDGG
jgi:sulfur-oxidizing protein SoxY